jgi:hypothetical protein
MLQQMQQMQQMQLAASSCIQLQLRSVLQELQEQQ